VLYIIKTCSHFITSRFTSNVMRNLSNVISVSQLIFFKRRYAAYTTDG
jgi:hypothetical protein